MSPTFLSVFGKGGNLQGVVLQDFIVSYTISQGFTTGIAGIVCTTI